MEKTKKLVILGDSAFAEIAYEYFTHDSPYDVVGFAVEQAFLKRGDLFGLPVVPFESIETQFDPQSHEFFAAVTYGQLNRLRTRLYTEAKARGYHPASYISSHAFVWRNVEIGEHCFIFENNVVQPFSRLGNNVVLWSGNHVGHHSIVGDNCFVASHAVISGFVEIGANCFVGVNATFANNIRVGADCVIGAGALVASDVDEDKVMRGAAGEPTGSARRLNRIRT
ncbi:acetyltransferase [Paraburkholderia unamae]|uniref:Sugar O-acyltransferase (Sialic acid O-acetyltransferase NeuD family) n=1 Tax=Paraburkholderia unamae TaxID=219649 RepID=A0ABX5KKM8_9BURK|nr:acetyltransferase [Paraburkholderia unamae]PVX82307.1 sugar O-acyltransferase (sialic acid O-acetyltransferase NeuD family) [Paraburkholderia unamae]